MRKLIYIFILFSLPGFGQKGVWPLHPGDTTDHSGNGYTLSGVNYVGQPTWTDGAVVTDRATAKYLKNTSVNMGNGAITMGCWFMPLENAPASKYIFLSSSTGTTYTDDYLSTRGTGNHLSYTHGRRGSNEIHATNAATYTVGVWYHVVATFSGTATGNMILYVNGVAVATNTNAANGTSSSLTGFTVGAHTSGSDNISGRVFGAFIDQRVWSPAQVKNEYMKLKHPL